MAGMAASMSSSGGSTAGRQADGGRVGIHGQHWVAVLQALLYLSRINQFFTGRIVPKENPVLVTLSAAKIADRTSYSFVLVVHQCFLAGHGALLENPVVATLSVASLMVVAAIAEALEAQRGLSEADADSREAAMALMQAERATQVCLLGRMARTEEEQPMLFWQAE
eukprot:1162039-Pelagomonas_calceolata.AAC.9